MPVTQQQLDSFHHFASQCIQSKLEIGTFEDLLFEWESTLFHSDVHAAIKEGLEDINAGRTRAARLVTQELKDELGI